MQNKVTKALQTILVILQLFYTIYFFGSWSMILNTNHLASEHDFVGFPILF